MDLIKKNIVLVVCMGISLAVSLALIYVVIGKFGAMKKSLAEVEKIKNEINDLNQKDPAPLQENIDRIHKETRDIDKKLTALQSIFGKPYSKAIGDFALALDLSREELVKQWRELYSSEIKKGGHPSQIFLKFMSAFDREAVEQAVDAFRQSVEARSIEKLTETNTPDIIMEALGVPRQMSPVLCKTYIASMLAAVKSMLVAKEEGEHTVLVSKDAEDFTFAELVDKRMPREDETSYITKNWKVIEDIAFRLKENEIPRLNKLSRSTLKGREENGYLFLSYDIEIEGPQENIRLFLNSLQDAYLDNRIYIIRDMTLEKSVDGAAKLDGASKPRTVATPAATGEDELLRLRLAQEEFGRPIIGRSKDIKVKFTFDYVIYTEDELDGSK